MPIALPPTAQVWPVAALAEVDPGLADVRLTSFRFDLLTRDEVLVGPLHGVQPGGSISWSAQASIKSGGTITVRDVGQQVDWLNARIRPIVTVTDLETGAVGEWPLGIFLCAAPKEAWTDAGRAWEVELIDKASILDTDIVTANGRPTAFTLPSGSNVIAAIVALIRDSGEDTPAIEANPAENLAASMTWDMGTTKLKIVNDLLDAANYFSIWCDGEGQFQCTPYEAPQSRPPVYEMQTPFSYGELSRLSPDWTHDRDIYSVPNRYVLIGQGSDEVPAWVALAINNNPTSEFSYVNRGRWVTFVETGVEATSEIALKQSAERRLATAARVTSKIEVAHPFLPDLRVNATVRFTNTLAELDLLTVITNLTVALEPAALCTTALEEVMS